MGSAEHGFTTNFAAAGEEVAGDRGSVTSVTRSNVDKSRVGKHLTRLAALGLLRVADPRSVQLARAPHALRLPLHFAASASKLAIVIQLSRTHPKNGRKRPFSWTDQSNFQ